MSKLKSLFKLPVCEDPSIMEQQKRLYPAVFIEQTSAMLLGLVNVAVTGTISSAALAGVGQVNTFNNVITYFFSNYAMGGNVMVAQNVGAKNPEGVKKSAAQSLLLGMIGNALYIYALFRCFSRNVPKRQAENNRYVHFLNNWQKEVKQFFLRLKGTKEYKYFRCPACKNRLRLRRGCGEKHITCPVCKHQFDQRA